MTETLIHYSAEPLTEVYSVLQDVRHRGIGKPNGLWFSVGDDEDGWRAWCEGAMPERIKDRIATEIILADGARILRLASDVGIDAFTVEYGFVPEWAAEGHGHKEIDWPKVAAKHHGIIIAPYVWSRRLERHTYWYCGWDCASGCIWDKAAVDSLKQSPKHDVQPK